MKELIGLGCEIIGSPEWSGVRNCSDADENDLTWFKDGYIETKAGTIICKRGVQRDDSKNYILHDTPKFILSVILQREVVTNTLVKGEGCEIGENVQFIGDVVLGDNVTIGGNSVIGSHGASFVEHEGRQYLLKHIGRTVIGSNVDIGVLSYVNRGVLSDTVIGDGVKIGNHVGIGHNVIIGDNAIILPFSLIGGSARIGQSSYIAPHTFVLNHAVVDGGSFIKSNIVKK